MLALVALLGAACATPGPDSLEEGEAIRLGARFAPGEITDRAPAGGSIDAAGLLRDALERALAARELRWSGEAAEDHYVVDLAIAAYEPGNAFKRWLLPGYGATILRVQGSLVDPREASVAASIEHERSVYFGGAYTIGAWRRIFDSVAADIARDLEHHARATGFFVRLAPWSSREIEIPAAEHRRPLVVGSFRDARTERGRIGERHAALGVSMGDIHFARDVAEYLREAVSDDLRAAGHTLLEAGAPEELTGEVMQFWVRTDATPLYWDIVSEIAVSLSLRAVSSDGRAVRSCAHRCQARERTYTWPSEGRVAQSLDACLTELLDAVRRDPMWLAPPPAPPSGDPPPTASEPAPSAARVPASRRDQPVRAASGATATQPAVRAGSAGPVALGDAVRFSFSWRLSTRRPWSSTVRAASALPRSAGSRLASSAPSASLPGRRRT